MATATDRPAKLPAQHQERHPGISAEMQPQPAEVAPFYRGSSKLDGKVALITGGDSGIGRSVAILYAREGADVAIVYLNEHDDARTTQKLVQAEGRRCLLLAGDVGRRDFCKEAVRKTVDEFGKLDILVNNAAVQYVQERLEDISEEQLETTFRTNIFGMFFLTQAAMEHLKEGASIINSTSITAFQGNPTLIDYSSTKGAILAFTRALSQSLAEKGIRVNAVAPGPIWTPLIPSSFPAEKVAEFGQNTPLGRPGQPEEVAPSYVFLASADSSYMTGQTLHPNGGQVVGG
jgi:NAD(P)-dependent dehydrogenase (short-subunit alcohol dehydrogenase family)